VLRRFHDLSQRELADRIGSPMTAITGYERGRKEPKGIVLDALCAALLVEGGYFFAERNDDEFHEDETNFRSLKATPDRLRKQALAHGTLFAAVLGVLATKARLPTLVLPKFQASTLDDIETAAERCRIEWGVGIDAPIQSVTLMLEHAGIVVTVLNREISKKVDAFSRYGTTNIIVLNPAKGSATRMRMDLSHEAGHGALHQHGLPSDLSVRGDQAKYFARALLLPRRAFAREFCAIRYRDWPDFLELKRRWGVSVAAIVIRSYHLGLIDAAEYRRRYKEMSRGGWLRGEPEEPEAESPQLFSLALHRYQKETGKSTRAIAGDLQGSPELFKRVTGIEAVNINDVADGANEASVSPFEAFRLKKLAGNN
jgi:Zn-dependent peptidase ImmA (M78 family)/transcriptional regulator with XRE-family HTH domain